MLQSTQLELSYHTLHCGVTNHSDNMYMAWFVAHSDNASGFEGQVREWLFSSQYGLNIKGLSYVERNNPLQSIELLLL